MRQDKEAMAVVGVIVLTVIVVVVQLIRGVFFSHDSAPVKPISTFEDTWEIPILTTTTESTTTTVAARTTTTRANRGQRRSDDFWRRLAQCESEMGRTSRNIFQFSPDTAGKVGIDGSEPYDVQRAAAIRWAAIIHPGEGTIAGWPNCWWVALKGGT
jgi:hypothetical protein